MELVKAKHLDRYEKKVMAGLLQGAKGFLEMGEGLYEINSGNLWLEAGSKSFDAYVDGHLPISRSTAYNAISFFRVCHRPMLEDPSLQTIEPTRVIKLLPHFTDENTAELLHNAASIPNARAFDCYLRELKGKVPPDRCETHDFQPIGIEQCTVCGLRRKYAEKTLKDAPGQEIA
jgi:hypothetical protein